MGSPFDAVVEQRAIRQIGQDITAGHVPQFGSTLLDVASQIDAQLATRIRDF